MTRIVTHQLPSAKRAGFVVREILRIYGERRRVVVWVADEARRRVLDDYLWTWEKLSFLPHCVWSAGMGQIEDPVVLLGEVGNPNGAEALVVADDLPPEDWICEFDEVHDFIPPGDEGVERERWWAERRDAQKEMTE
ncbi:MAG: DNA polymerase III subunit chi [Thermoanaerobaculales bacterium]|nr:DNA polymerase III subunit chi [Thermoanaerobaculales bacterium]